MFFPNKKLTFTSFSSLFIPILFHPVALSPCSFSALGNFPYLSHLCLLVVSPPSSLYKTGVPYPCLPVFVSSCFYWSESLLSPCVSWVLSLPGFGLLDWIKTPRAALSPCCVQETTKKKYPSQQIFSKMYTTFRDDTNVRKSRELWEDWENSSRNKWSIYSVQKRGGNMKWLSSMNEQREHKPGPLLTFLGFIETLNRCWQKITSFVLALASILLMYLHIWRCLIR